MRGNRRGNPPNMAIFGGVGGSPQTRAVTGFFTLLGGVGGVKSKNIYGKIRVGILFAPYPLFFL